MNEQIKGKEQELLLARQLRHDYEDLERANENLKSLNENQEKKMDELNNKNEDLKSGFSVYPNPVKDKLYLVCDFNTDIEPLLIRYGVGAMIKNSNQNIKIAIDLKTIVENKYES